MYFPPEELDLDYGDLALEDEETELLEVHLSHTDKMPPGSGETDWAPIRQALIDHRVAKGRNPDGTKIPPKVGDSKELTVTVTEAGVEIPTGELNASAKGYAKRVTACKNCPHDPQRHSDGVCGVRGCECAGYATAGWEIKAQRSATHNAATLYLADSKASEDGEEGHFVGDILYPAEDRTHYGLAGVLMNQGKPFAMFEVTYEARPKDGKLVPKFASARWRDGISGSGFSLVAGDFGEWFDIFFPPATPRTPRKTLEEKRDAKLAAPIESGEWTG